MKAPTKKGIKARSRSFTQMMTAAVYARVSTTDQNCAMQLRELREFGERSKWTLVEYVDEGYSGAKADRPALNRLMADARLKKFELVVCWKLDRFGRSMLNLIENIQTLSHLGIRFVCPTQGIDTDQNNPAARLILNILAALAEFERELIRERVNAGVQEYRRAYREGRIGKARHSRSGKDLPHGRPKKLFRRDHAMELRAQGRSWRDIAAELGVPVSTVRRAVAIMRK